MGQRLDWRGSKIGEKSWRQSSDNCLEKFCSQGEQKHQNGAGGEGRAKKK